MNKINVVIVGSGAIGNMLVVLLGKVKSSNPDLIGNIYQLIRNPETRKLISKSKVFLTIKQKDPSLDETQAFRPIIIYSLQQISEDYLLFPTMKAYDLPCFLPTIKTALNLKGIVAIQNGIGNEEEVVKFLVEKKLTMPVMSGIITLPVETIPDCKNKVIITNAKGGFGFAVCNSAEDQWLTEKITSIFEKTGFETIDYGFENWRSMKFTKALLNSIGNAQTVVEQRLNIFQDSNLVENERQQIREFLAVMKKIKLRLLGLPGYPLGKLKLLWLCSFNSFLFRKFVCGKVEKARGHKPPSMWIDFQAGKPSEVAWLNGVIANLYEEFFPGQGCINRQFYNSFQRKIIERDFKKLAQ